MLLVTSWSKMAAGAPATPNAFHLADMEKEGGRAFSLPLRMVTLSPSWGDWEVLSEWPWAHSKMGFCYSGEGWHGYSRKRAVSGVSTFRAAMPGRHGVRQKRRMNYAGGSAREPGGRRTEWPAGFGEDLTSWLWSGSHMGEVWDIGGGSWCSLAPHRARDHPRDTPRC